MSNGAYLPIENHGVIGDLHTVALVGTDGTIDFMSYPHFGSSTIFASLLDAENGGRFQLRPCNGTGTTKQMYLPDTNVLITRTLDRDGVAEVSDFMPVGTDEHEHCHALVRRAKGVRGGSAFDVIFDPRFDYGRAGHKVDVREGEILFHSEGPDGTTVRLRSQVMQIPIGASTIPSSLSRR